MWSEGLIGIYALLAVLALIYLALPPKKPPQVMDPNLVRCPKCGTSNPRTCPNCGNIIPRGTTTCPACFLTASAIPCRVCKTDLKAIP